MSKSKDWYYFAIEEIRKSRKRLSPIEKAFLVETEYTILGGKPLDEHLERHLMGLYEEATEIRRLK